MSSMELEVKVQNVDEEELSKKIESLGGRYVSTSKQYLYVYDLMCINQRFLAYLYEYNNETIELRKEINLEKIKNLFYEVDQLLSKEDSVFLKNRFSINNLLEIFSFEVDYIEKIVNDKELADFLNKFRIPQNKWIRLRKNVEENSDKSIREKITLTIKHVLKDNQSGIQQMKETEIFVNSFEEANELLENLGFYHRGYQEKRRVKYILDKHEIDIDTWPGLPTYFEVEGKDKEDLERILNLLGYSFEDTISCTVDEIYKKIGIDVNNMKELKFE